MAEVRWLRAPASCKDDLEVHCIPRHGPVPTSGVLPPMVAAPRPVNLPELPVVVPRLFAIPSAAFFAHSSAPLLMLVNFGQTPGQGADHARTVKGWVYATLDPSEESTVLVTELRCTEPGCPPLETVIAVLSPGNRREVRVHAPLADITREQVEEALRRRPPTAGA